MVGRRPTRQLPPKGTGALGTRRTGRVFRVLRRTRFAGPVFSVQLNAAQPAAEQLVCFDEGPASCASVPSELDGSPADPLRGSSSQCSVFSVQSDVAQPAAEQLGVVVKRTTKNETSITANSPNETSISAIYSQLTPCYSLIQGRPARQELSDRNDPSDPQVSSAEGQYRFLQTEATDVDARPDRDPRDTEPEHFDPGCDQRDSAPAGDGRPAPQELVVASEEDRRPTLQFAHGIGDIRGP
jgi:hypothetical protein